MWCPRCHTEVAAEIAQNGQSLNCTSCGTEIQRIYAPSLHPDTRSARELLDRWSKSDLLDVATESPSTTPGEASLPPITATVHPPASLVTAPPQVSASQPQPQPQPTETTTAIDESASELPSTRRDRPERAKPDRPTPKPRTTWRVDAAHTVTQPATPLPPPVPPRRPHFSAVAGDTPAGEAEKFPTPIAPPPSATVRTELAAAGENEAHKPVRPRSREPVVSQMGNELSIEDHSEPDAPRADAPRAEAARPTAQRRLDPAHQSLGGPHFDLQAFLAQDGRKPGRSESIWGQVLAYAGVGLITVGTTMVLWAWFSESPQYAPTGWLICTVGQMLLFLGVITLVSGGMQQTSHEVTRRVEYLGDRILRFEQSAEQAMRGPHFHETRDRSKATSAQSESTDEEFVSDPRD